MVVIHLAKVTHFFVSTNFFRHFYCHDFCMGKLGVSFYRDMFVEFSVKWINLHSESIHYYKCPLDGVHLLT